MLSQNYLFMVGLLKVQYIENGILKIKYAPGLCSMTQWSVCYNSNISVSYRPFQPFFLEKGKWEKKLSTHFVECLSLPNNHTTK